jgi:hypothetical protein
LQGYATHNAQIDYPNGYHLVSDVGMYELLPHPRYQNPYNYNAQQIQQVQQTQGQQPRAQGQQLQIQGPYVEAQGQPRQQVAGTNADELVSKITSMMQS